jgi:hypothetical protein
MPQRKRGRCADCGGAIAPGQEYCAPCRAVHVAMGDLRLPAMTPEQRSDRAIARAEELAAKDDREAVTTPPAGRTERPGAIS